jgi:hypothetical protein
MSIGKHRNTAGLKPFAKGPDPRRWKHGQKSKEAVKVSRDIQQWLSVVGDEIYELGQTYSEALARKLWDRAVKGDMQAAGLVIDRLLGKPVQPISGEVTHVLSFDFGNGENGKENG